ncbi:uncharacterized protein LOC114328611 [Diabrotica virgifera virgifera]|uniref:Uncharacterized protein LOC114328611 n=2 Tax=Diabrotica virgifera virgifera TaxID=50390 RepID=A0A6P7FEQ1_DIAVI|nr:uncharacterized protein LOC114328611 [Diabrotica virgifera virgifera]XP_028133302.1 uncharacterized protein LOC114328611 [Diabrotica virgifera virgifera]XP_050510295.1 uncharacterized protein LOC114328611 [Diabrotica virgifera virgifera]
MERIFKIKMKTDRVPQSQYPSERRYSASIVIGLSVVYMQLFLFSILMGTLLVHKMTVQNSSNLTYQNETELNLNPTNNITKMLRSPPFNDTESIAMADLYETMDNNFKEVSQSLQNLQNVIDDQNVSNIINISILMCAGCYIMAIGFAVASVTGIFAWKQWYIDHNIKFFFLASAISVITAAIGLLLSLITCIILNFDYDSYVYETSKSPITFSLAMNIVILSTVGVIWSFLASKIAYVGVRSSYPDDIVFNRGGRCVEVSVEHKGNKSGIVFPPDILEHFPSGDKLTKYLPKKENGNLPKAESTLEYQQRVNKFLSEVPDTNK